MVRTIVNDQTVLQLTYLSALQLTLSLGGKVTLETLWVFVQFFIRNSIFKTNNVRTAKIKVTVCFNTVKLFFLHTLMTDNKIS